MIIEINILISQLCMIALETNVIDELKESSKVIYLMLNLIILCNIKHIYMKCNRIYEEALRKS